MKTFKWRRLRVDSYAVLTLSSSFLWSTEQAGLNVQLFEFEHVMSREVDNGVQGPWSSSERVYVRAWTSERCGCRILSVGCVSLMPKGSNVSSLEQLHCEYEGPLIRIHTDRAPFSHYSLECPAVELVQIPWHVGSPALENIAQ